MPGPRRTPTAIRQLHGTDRPDRRVANEVTPPASLPSPPAALGAIGKREWRRVGAILLAHGLVTELDREMLFGLCASYETAYLATKELGRLAALTHETPNGHSQTSALVNVQSKALEKMHKFAAEFGLSPSARTKATPAAVAAEIDEFDAWKKRASRDSDSD